MNEAEIKEIKKRLIKEIETTHHKIIEYSELCKPIPPENSIGRISRMDAINNKSVIEAALREIYEETGIKKPTYIRSLGKFKRYRIGLDGNDDLSELKTIAIYLFKSNQINLQPIDPNNPEAIWVNVEEAYKLLSHKEDKSFFKKSLSLWLK